MKRANYHAFTIIELLVVVAIILILTALLMPTLSRVRETAKNVKCISNLRQISMVTHLYAADYDGLAPWNPKMTNESMFTRWSRDPDAELGSYNPDYPKNKWLSEYFPDQTPYGTMVASAYCPSGGRYGPRGSNVPIGKLKGSNLMTQPNLSYGINYYLTKPDWFYQKNYPDKGAVPLSQVKNPSKVCLWVDSTKNFTYPVAWSLDGRHFSKSKHINGDTPSKNGYPIYRCVGRANVAYVDQRIGFVTVSGPDDPYEVSPDPGSQFWNHLSVDSPYPETQAKNEGWTTIPPYE